MKKIWWIVIGIILLLIILIGGYFFVKSSSICKNKNYNVNQINEKVVREIDKLFSEDQKIYVYLQDYLAEIEQGGKFSVFFSWTNLMESNTTNISKFSYKVSVYNGTLKSCSGLSVNEAESFIVAGKSSSPRPLASGDKDYGLIKFQIPESAPLCSIRYILEINRNNRHYASNFWDINITKKKPLFQKIKESILKTIC